MGFLTSCAQKDVWGGRVSHHEVKQLGQVINPHLSPIKTLIVDGKRFGEVCGSPPYYVPRQGCNAIVFVVDKIGYGTICHVYFMDSKKDVPFRIGDGFFKRMIGSPELVAAIESYTDSAFTLSITYPQYDNSDPDSAASYSQKFLFQVSTNQNEATGITRLDLDGQGVVIRKKVYK